MVAVLSETEQAAPVPVIQPEWHARLGLDFVSQGGRTRMRRQWSEGPLYVQKPFYPERDVCHVCLLHPPGGVAGGDQLEVELSVGAGANALVTTPAASKFYRCRSADAVLRHSFHVQTGGVLEWLPQETIFFGGCRARLRACIRLEVGATYVGMELSCLGRPASGDAFTHGSVDMGVTLIRVDGDVERPLLIERNDWQAGDAILREPWGLGGRLVFGSLFAVSVDEDVFEWLRSRHGSATRHDAGQIHAMTRVDDVLIARVLANEAETARKWLRSVWADVRPLVTGRSPCPPRIWQT